jgi:hypothetical protein
MNTTFMKHTKKCLKYVSSCALSGTFNRPRQMFDARRLVYTFVTLLFCAVGCTTRTSDPMTGWSLCRSQDPAKMPKAIIDDYHAYVSQLPAGEKHSFNEYSSFFFENEAGQHAVKIEIPLHGVWLEHLLIYDSDNKRIDVKTFTSGHYAS